MSLIIHHIILFEMTMMNRCCKMSQVFVTKKVK